MRSIIDYYLYITPNLIGIMIKDLGFSVFVQPESHPDF